jgi:hypothetical protein
MLTPRGWAAEWRRFQARAVDIAISRFDHVALRRALVVAHVRPGIALLVTIFDRDVAAHLRATVLVTGDAYDTGGRRSAQGWAASSWAASVRSTCSSFGRPMSWTPSGRPSSVW